ncbi:hypothetical protein EDM54_23790 [Brevibacillus borstelensis]|uniref:hypothetical protein n=1 Tax=Brevibacillus borstelensis TaxID=45462 RepID=UPI000F094DE1|nr:hypothetical protein [Brevibacillus borstelensis]MED1885928.1 hypothetical protein [Brevibacillus borstelensis]RNB56643.1 hypothetical protein EDM54_23790 [Brevibacillus borstelensis]GED55868.1 hypothetical protein BBO01nite_51090 [Brevibacillus borstelensis]
MDKPSVEQVAWVFEKVAESIREGGGSFRHLIYDRMGFDEKAYIPLYKAGGMVITNTIFDTLDTIDEYHEALLEIDTHVRSTPEPIPYIVDTLKRALPEYREGEGI